MMTLLTNVMPDIINDIVIANDINKLIYIARILDVIKILRFLLEEPVLDDDVI